MAIMAIYRKNTTFIPKYDIIDFSYIDNRKRQEKELNACNPSHVMFIHLYKWFSYFLLMIIKDKTQM